MGKEYVVVVCEPGGLPYLKKIDASLEGLQKEVGGYIELFYATSTGLDFFCNDEGLLLGLPPNRRFGRNIIAGNILVTSHNEEGDTVSLTQAQAFEALWTLLDFDIKLEGC